MKLAAEFNPDDERDEWATVFPGGVISSPEEVIRQQLEYCVAEVNNLLILRYEFSVAGAMRWPWSQEAPMYRRRPRTDSYTDD